MDERRAAMPKKGDPTGLSVVFLDDGGKLMPYLVLDEEASGPSVVAACQLTHAYDHEQLATTTQTWSNTVASLLQIDDGQLGQLLGDVLRATLRTYSGLTEDIRRTLPLD